MLRSQTEPIVTKAIGFYYLSPFAAAKQVQTAELLDWVVERIVEAVVAAADSREMVANDL